MKVYSVNVGDYDSPNPLKGDFEYTLLTEDVCSNPLLSSRYHKTHPPFPPTDGETILYLDHNFHLLQGADLNAWALSQLQDNDIVFNASFRSGDCFDEIDYVLSRGKGDYDILTKQASDYKAEEVPEKTNLAQGGIFIFRDSPEVRYFLLQWWQEFRKYPSRDQIALHKLRLQTELKIGWMNPYSLFGHPTLPERYDPVFEYRIHPKQPINIHYSNPWGKDKNLGKAYNDFCELVPDDEDWIVLQDGDIVYLHDYWGDIIEDTIRNNPDINLFGCYTNRLGLKWQLHNGKLSNSPSITKHMKISDERAARYWGKATKIDKPIAGLFMAFKKKHWKERPFKEGLYLRKDNALVDWDFTSSFLERGLKIGLMEGLYVFHKYRIGRDIKDIKHLL